MRLKPAIYHFLLLLVFFATIDLKTQAQSVLYFGGEVASNLNWTKDHIYVINSDLIIPQGFSLTIHPGTEVYINYNVSIICNGGGFIVNGEENGVVDSVFIRRNTLYNKEKQPPQKNWYWKKIYINQATDSSQLYVNYAHFEYAEIALEIESSSNFIIQNSTFNNNQSNCLKLKNALHSKIRNNLFENNYVSIEFVSDMAHSIGNNVSGNKFYSDVTSISINGKSEGQFVNNFIDGNTFEQSNCAIFAQDKSVLNTPKNWIRNNTINTKENSQSYGIWVEMDSLQIEHNIFWKNERTLGFDGAKRVSIKGNTFYKNDSCVSGINTSWNVDFQKNTFSENNFMIARVPNANSSVTSNNIVHHKEDRILFYNASSDSIFIGNNYWGTTDTALIANFLWDMEDDENRGVLNYKPILETTDTTAPLVPPYRVKKQLVADQLRLVWEHNNEENIKGYRIYSGNLKHYAYTNFEGFTTDTVFFVDKTMMDIEFAVTATSVSEYLTSNYQKEIESAYAFAFKAPFAGKNDTICENQTSYLLESANVPYDYNRIEWRTSGSGRFSNSQELNPTYFPSKDDFTIGAVVLTLHVYTSENKKAVESMTLSLFQSIELFAGNDSIVKIHDSISLHQAKATNYTKLTWKTAGDGWFNDTTSLNPIYVLGETDRKNGYAQLVLKAESKCETAHDTVTFEIIPNYFLRGKVWIGDQGAKQAQVILKNLNDSNASTEQYRVKTNHVGEFEFRQLSEDKYIIYASPDTLDEKTSIAYYSEKYQWQQAHRIDLVGNTFDVDIHLPTDFQNLQEGVGVIAGVFKLPVEQLRETQIYCADWFDRADEIPICDGGFSNVAIVLYNSDGTKRIDYTLTDHKGKFSFRKLPFGSYIIMGEVFGFETIQNEVIQLTPSDYYVDDIELTLQEDKITLKRNPIVEPNEIALIYPNPVSDVFYINGPENWKLLSVFNTMGVRVLQIDLLDNNSSAAVSIEHLASGLYFLRLENEQIQKTVKILKK
ncbi:MAG: T9SS type A sorting domain-containing protein [Lentimicrobiaceae bacterium]|jgi:hypothetical protein|nr:T9SS type A sorting domain-containing protein [Lentimicrobiaceae bacterium]